MSDEYSGGQKNFNPNEFLEFIIKAIVDHPDDVKITEVDGEKTIIYELRVNQKDMGKVIGKRGQNARAIRTLLAAASGKRSKRSVLEILE